jgi:short-subunit dehydrogenase
MARFALVTGGSSGIGEQYVRQLAAEGHNVIVVSNRDEDNRRVAEAVRAEFGVEALSLTIDLAEPTAAEQIFAFCEGHAIEVDILVNNAGMLIFNQLERTDSARIDTIIALHCTTPTKLCRLFAPAMRVRGEGHIVLMSSVTAWTPFPTISHYAATKAYLRSFAQSLWYELRGRGVSVTVVFPSAVDTPFYNLDSGQRRVLRRVGLMLSAETVARKALRAMFSGKRRCLPGVMTKIEAVICWLLPAWALLPILKIPAVRKLLDKI